MQNAKRIFGVALAAAAITVLGVQRVLESPGVMRRIKTKPVAVALEDIDEGLVIQRTSITMAQFPLGTIPAGAATSIDSVVGRVARVKIFKGEVFVRGRLAQNTP
jgi:pilus assembly protein CpaB